MLVRARRPVGSICIALLTLNLVQCTEIKREGVQPVIQPDRGDAAMKNVVGVTLKDGRDIRFDEKTRAILRGDTLQDQVSAQPLAIPVSDLQLLWVRTVNNTRTSFLVTGLLVVALVAFAAIGASQIDYGGLP
jgi:hypothetical protein